MEVPGGDQNKLRVCTYEALGTAFLVYAVIVSGGNIIAVPLTLLIAIVMAGPVTGAHFNPAVTVAVYIQQRKFGENLGFFFFILIAEFVGALFGLGIALVSIFPSKGQEWPV